MIQEAVKVIYVSLKIVVLHLNIHLYIIDFESTLQSTNYEITNDKVEDEIKTKNS